MRIRFGHCIGCDQAIRPPFLSFAVHEVAVDGEHILEWQAVDVCAPCAGKLTADDLHRLVTAEGVEA